MHASTSVSYLLGLYPHLTPRDRLLLALLDEHQVFTTDQVRRLAFTAMRTCQIRLRELHHLGLLDRFRFALSGGGSEPWHWTLGLHGARFRAGATGRASPTERTHREKVLRLTANPYLGHLMTTNEFGIRLAAAARHQDGLRVDRWWSERTTTARFMRVRPDAHGLWTADDRTVGWFLECDMGTESLPRLLAKLDAYQQLTAAGGPRYPVLFWLPGPARETNLQRLLRHHRPAVPVATATHDTDPAAPVWLNADGDRRVPLADLPGGHGSNSAANPNFVDGHLDLTDQAETA